jgi:anti-anti-sigma regulatory factor
MDAQRAQQVLVTALNGAQSSHARVVILDITGVILADGSIASSLLSAAGALRMLGAEVVITGIRPEVARAMIELSADLGAIAIRGTLKSGILYALSRSSSQRFDARAQGRGDAKIH